MTNERDRIMERLISDTYEDRLEYEQALAAALDEYAKLVMEQAEAVLQQEAREMTQAAQAEAVMADQERKLRVEAEQEVQRLREDLETAYRRLAATPGTAQPDHTEHVLDMVPSTAQLDTERLKVCHRMMNAQLITPYYYDEWLDAEWVKKCAPSAMKEPHAKNA